MLLCILKHISIDARPNIGSFLNAAVRSNNPGMKKYIVKSRTSFIYLHYNHSLSIATVSGARPVAVSVSRAGALGAVSVASVAVAPVSVALRTFRPVAVTFPVSVTFALSVPIVVTWFFFCVPDETIMFINTLHTQAFLLCHALASG